MLLSISIALITIPHRFPKNLSHLVKIAVRATSVATMAATALLRGALPRSPAASFGSIAIVLGTVRIVVACSTLGTLSALATLGVVCSGSSVGAQKLSRRATLV